MLRKTHAIATTAPTQAPSPGRWEGDGRGDRGEVSGGGTVRSSATLPHQGGALHAHPPSVFHHSDRHPRPRRGPRLGPHQQAPAPRPPPARPHPPPAGGPAPPPPTGSPSPESRWRPRPAR